MVRIGRVFRAVRIRRGWRQSDLAAKARVSVASIRRIEHGECGAMVLPTLTNAAAALDIRLDLQPSWRGADLGRMLNAGHAAMHEQVATLLGGLSDWQWAAEVSFAIYGERGIIDILAFHSPTGILLVVELKTEIVEVEELVGVMDRRRRLAIRIAGERGWRAQTVSCWVIVSESQTNRRRLAAHTGVLRHAFPIEGPAMREWLRHPQGEVSALSFLSKPRSVSGKTNESLPRRVRKGRDRPIQG